MFQFGIKEQAGVYEGIIQRDLQGDESHKLTRR